MLFEAQDKKKNCIRPGLLLYYKKIPAYLLTNQYTLLGIVNGIRAIVYRVVLYLNSKNILSGNIKANKKQAFLRKRLNLIIILYSYLLIYILLKRPKRLEITFLILLKNVFLVFLAKSTLTIYNISITRLQIPITPGFAVTDYMIQEATF